MKKIYAILIALVLIAGPFSSLTIQSKVAEAATLQVPLLIKETAGIARSGEIVEAGIPLSKDLNIKDTSTLSITSSAGTKVPAQFTALARWGGGKNNTALPIQWVLAIFPADVSAGNKVTYTLTTGSNPAPAKSLSVNKNSNEVTVDTGEAVFTVGPDGLFKSVKRGSSTLVSDGNLSATIEGKTGASAEVREVTIERSGPLSAIVVVKGTYDLSFGEGSGDGAIAYTRRYEFKAGSPTAIVRHVVTWEGSWKGMGFIASTTPTGFNMLTGTKLRDTLKLSSTPATVTVIGKLDKEHEVPFSGKEIALRTRLREKIGDKEARLEPRIYEITAGGSLLEKGTRNGPLRAGDEATGGMLAAQISGNTLGVAIKHMHQYEPQALRLLSDGTVAIDIADDKFNLANYQGLFATLAVSALPSGVSQDELNKEMWAPLNAPLRALPSVGWVNDTGAIDKIPENPLPADLLAYNIKIPNLLRQTLAQAEQYGVYGLMTHGLWPRLWDEWTGKKGLWNSTYLDATWTDYYSTSATAGIWALRSGDSEFLEKISIPAALRSLHTQIIQGAPDSKNFYAGQGVSGYGGYRKDLNSKHHYWDNLYLYYFLTGDETVLDIITRGAEAQRKRYLDGKSSVNGAVAAMWMMSWRFLGDTAEDSSHAQNFSETFRKAVTEMITEHYVELTWNGKTYGFISNEKAGSPLTMSSQWTVGGFDMENLYWFMQLTNDAPVGPNQIRPGRMLTNIARTFVELLPSPELKRKDGTLLGGDGTISGRWARAVEVSYSGSQIGGQLNSINAVAQSSQWYLFPDDKPFMASFLSRAAMLGGDPAVQEMSRDLAVFGLSRITNSSKLGKLMGLSVHTLHPAIYEEANMSDSDPEEPVNDLIISNVSVSGDFSQTNTCSGPIADGGSCTVRVNFKPSVTGLRTGAVTIAHNMTGSPRTVILQGMGVAATSSLPTLDFTASPFVVKTGEKSALTWSTQNTASCLATGAWTGSKPLSGTYTTAALSATSTYSLTCLGTSGSVKKDVVVGITKDDQTSTTTQQTMKVTSFTLVNTKTDTDIRTFTNGDTIDLSQLRDITIRANAEGDGIGSVSFDLNGKRRSSDRVVPYSMTGDRNGNYKIWQTRAGNYALTATPWTGKYGNGAAGIPMTIQFTVTTSGTKNDDDDDSTQTTIKPVASWGEITLNDTADVVRSSDEKLNLQNDKGAVSAWFKMDNANIGQNRMFPLIWKRSHETNARVPAGYSLFAHQAGPTAAPYIRGRLGNTDGSKFDDVKSSKTPLQAGVWYHAVLTWDASTMNIYLNGSLEASASRTQTLAFDGTQPLFIGYTPNNLAGGYDYAKGVIEAAVYDKTLSASAVKTLYSSAGKVQGWFGTIKDILSGTITSTADAVRTSLKQLAAVITSGSITTTGTVTVTPVTLNFGNQPIGASSPAMDITITYNASSVAGMAVSIPSGRFERDLTVGSRGKDVEKLQKLLNTAGFAVASSGEGSAGNESEYFGMQTQQALKAFQERYKNEILTPTGLTGGSGYFGSATRAKANELLQTYTMY